MRRRHVMTPARKAALRKAQLASAHKRRGHGHGKLAAANRRYDTMSHRIGITGAVIGAVLGAHVVALQGRHFLRRKRR